MAKEKSVITGYDEYLKEVQKEEPKVEIILDSTQEEENWLKAAIKNWEKAAEEELVEEEKNK